MWLIQHLLRWRKTKPPVRQEDINPDYLTPEQLKAMFKDAIATKRD